MIKVGSICRIKSRERLLESGWRDEGKYYIYKGSDLGIPIINKLMLNSRVIVESTTGVWKNPGIGKEDGYAWSWHIEMLEKCRVGIEERT